MGWQANANKTANGGGDTHSRPSVPAASQVLDIGEDGVLRRTPQAAYEPLHPHPFEADYYEQGEREW